MENTLSTAAKGHRDSASSTLARVIDAVANRFKSRPDLSLVDVKFTDALERELAERAHRSGTW
ncbi:MAG: hypothetical protein NVS3B7_16620 [Candidatus Elarobacter sp.]